MTFNSVSYILFSALAVGLCAGTANAASFDCDKAAKPDEITVCENRTLSNLDVEMATIYTIVGKLVPMGMRADQQDQQRQFLRERSTCGSDESCIQKLYKARISSLSSEIDRISQGGPY